MEELKLKLKGSSSYDILPIFENMFGVYLFGDVNRSDPTEILFYADENYKEVKEIINESGVPRNQEISLLQQRGFDYNKANR